MNVLEQMMMRKLANVVKNNSDPIDAASVLAAQEAIDTANKLTPSKVHGLIVIGVEADESNAEGEQGVSLSCVMVGAPAVLHALADTSMLMLRAASLKEEMANHPLGSLLNEIIGGGSMTSEKAHDRFSSAGKSTQ